MSAARKLKNTPTVAAARRVLAAAKQRDALPSVYQREAYESAPRLARRVLELERLVREWRAVAEWADELRKAGNGAEKR